jgi:hypothetical protein
MNTSENSIHSGLAWASDDGGDIVPEKGRLLEAECACWMPGEVLVSVS